MSMYVELVQLNPTINKLCDIVSSVVRANPSSISDEKRRGLPSQNTEGQTQLWAVERVTAIKKKTCVRGMEKSMKRQASSLNIRNGFLHQIFSQSILIVALSHHT